MGFTIVTCGAGSAYPSGAPEITHRFFCCFFFRVAKSLVFCVLSSVLLFVCFIFSHGVWLSLLYLSFLFVHHILSMMVLSITCYHLYKAFRYLPHSHEAKCITPIKTSCTIQLMLGNHL